MAYTNNVRSKAYTLTSLIKEVSSISNTQGQNATALISTLSPRKGGNSVKFRAIQYYLNGKMNRVLQGTSAIATGTTAKALLLYALRLRKNTGNF